MILLLTIGTDQYQMLREYGTAWYRMSRQRRKERAMSRDSRDGIDWSAKRERILDAAFATFTERGYAASSTLEIATRARVSKRELYTLVGNKQALLVGCIGRRATRLALPTDVPEPRDRKTLERALVTVGTHILLEVTEPNVVAAFRLAIAEALHAPEVAQTVNSMGRETIRAALRRMMAGAQASGLLDGSPAELADQFGALLWGNTMINLLLGVTTRPTSREFATRARHATVAFLKLNAPQAASAKKSRPRRSLVRQRRDRLMQ
ncbi:MAG: TetR/AcrR family transcriptional regulator [Gemmatimonadaceae bacterium]